jgi:hypothetical protein
MEGKARLPLVWKRSPPALEGYDAGYARLFAAIDEAGNLDSVLSEMWAAFVAEVAPAYDASGWDTVVVQLSPIRGLFVYPTATASGKRRRPGPGCIILQLKDMERRATVQALDPECVGERFKIERGALVQEYTKAIEAAARRENVFSLRSPPPGLEIQLEP